MTEWEEIRVSREKNFFGSKGERGKCKNRQFERFKKHECVYEVETIWE